MRQCESTRVYEALTPFQVLSSVVMSPDFHFKFLKAFNKIERVEILNDWYMDETHNTFLNRKTKIYLFNHQYCVLMDEKLYFNDDFDFDNCATSHVTSINADDQPSSAAEEVEIMKIKFTISVIEKESMTFPGTLNITGEFQFHLENSSSVNNKISSHALKENYFANSFRNNSFIKTRKALASASDETATSQVAESSNNNINVKGVAIPILDLDQARMVAEEEEIISTNREEQIGGDSSDKADENVALVQHTVSVTITVAIDYKVLIIGNVSSVEEKLCKQCTKLFNLWFEKVTLIEKSLPKTPTTVNNPRDELSTLSHKRSFHKINPSYLTVRTRTRTKRRSLPFRPVVIVSPQMLKEWIDDPLNNVWEFEDDETIPAKFIQKHDISEVYTELEMQDMIFDFLKLPNSDKKLQNTESSNTLMQPVAPQPSTTQPREEPDMSCCTTCCTIM